MKMNYDNFGDGTPFGTIVLVLAIIGIIIGCGLLFQVGTTGTCMTFGLSSCY
jgi:hypothetical protein